MQDAAQPRNGPLLAEKGEAVLPGFAAMNDDRQLPCAGALELLPKHFLLGRARRVVVVVVEPDFPPGQYARVLCQGVQRGEQFLAGMASLVRMQSDGGPHEVVLLGQS